MHEETERSVSYYFTKERKDPYETCRWVQRTVTRHNNETTVTFPDSWSVLAAESLVSAAFLDDENDLRQAIDRIVNTITKVGYEHGYFISERDADTFHAEVKHLLLTQKITFSLEVWSTLGTTDPVSVESTSHTIHAISDLFMRAVEADGEWRALEPPAATGKARELWQGIVRDIWRHSDTRLEYSSIQEANRIVRGSTEVYAPAAIVNIEKFVAEEGVSTEALQQAVSLVYIALDILTQCLQLETTEATEYLRYQRPISFGITNVASALVALGIPYDSADAKNLVQAWQALCCGQIWTMSSQLAGVLGPFVGYESHTQAVARVLRQGQQTTTAIASIPEELRKRTKKLWQELLRQYKRHGLRNCAIIAAHSSFMDQVLDTKSKGIAPLKTFTSDVAIASGGKVRVVSESVALGLKRLKYDKEQAVEIINHIHAGKDMKNIPHLSHQHKAVFALEGTMKHPYKARVALAGAMQPLVTGGSPLGRMVIPGSTSLRDVEKLLTEAWYAGVATVVLQRDGTEPHKEPEQRSKPPQVAVVTKNDNKEQEKEDAEEVVADISPLLETRKLAAVRQGKTFSFIIDTTQCYVTVNEFEDGTPGEILVHVPHASLMTILHVWAQSVSIGLQHGVPLAAYTETAKGTSFLPQGKTDDAEIPTASSIIDYIARRLECTYVKDQIDSNS